MEPALDKLVISGLPDVLDGLAVILSSARAAAVLAAVQAPEAVWA